MQALTFYSIDLVRLTEENVMYTKSCKISQLFELYYYTMWLTALAFIVIDQQRKISCSKKKRYLEIYQVLHHTICITPGKTSYVASYLYRRAYESKNISKFANCFVQYFHKIVLKRFSTAHNELNLLHFNVSGENTLDISVWCFDSR